MNLSYNQPIKGITAADIHNFIGTGLRETFKDFVYNKKRKQMERENNLKTDVILWSYGRHRNNTMLILDVSVGIRHNDIDRLYEKLFNEKPFSKYSIRYWPEELRNIE